MQADEILPKLTRLNNIMYASRILFTSRGSCDMAYQIAPRSASFPIHENEDIVGCAKDG